MKLQKISSDKKARVIAIHLIAWLAYGAYIYLANVLIKPNATVVNVLFYLIPFCVTFYLTIFLLNLYSKKGILWNVAIFFAVFLIMSAIGYAYIYLALPKVGVVIYSSTQFGFFLQEAMLGFFKYFALALLYFYISLSLKKDRKLQRLLADKHRLEMQRTRDELENTRLKQQELKARQEKLEYEYAYLRAQINPHFLHNTLNMLYSEAVNYSTGLAENILRLSSIMRYSLESLEYESGKVMIQKELEQLQTLIDINNQRFDKTKNIIYRVSGNIEGQMVSPDNYVPIPFSPGGYNRYLYANGNPLKYIDPTGWMTEKEFNDVLNDLWSRDYGGRWDDGSGIQYFTSANEAFGYGAGQMTQSGGWGGGGGGSGWASSPGEALGRYGSLTGTKSITADMWNGYMAGRWYSYGYNLATVAVSSGLGNGFLTSALTYQDASLGASTAQFFSYGVAERLFLSTQQNGRNGWYGTGGQINWFVAAAGTGLENTPGSFRLGTPKLGFSPKYYFNAWRGNQFAKTFNIGKIGGAIGKTSFAVGATMEIVGMAVYLKNPNSNNAVHPGIGAFNIGMGVYGTWVNPAAGMLYFGIDAFYPGGWPAAMENMDRIQRAILHAG